jgi:hypothetical protein
MYFLRITGFIPENKQVEFEQTIHLLKSQMPKSCSGFNTTRDITNKNNYQFLAYWEKLPYLKSFTRSSTCTMLLGAFRTLGKLKENTSGKMNELKPGGLNKSPEK